MGRLYLYISLMCFVVISIEAGINGECPPSGQHTMCSPKCLQDVECASMGGRCCPNLCNYKSCVIPKSGSNTGGAGYKGSGSSGSYCGNVKCNSFEKCELDRQTKRQKCIRT